MKLKFVEKVYPLTVKIKVVYLRASPVYKLVSNVVILMWLLQ